MKRVLVTGARGFIGQHSLRPLVDRGYDVHAVSRGEILSEGSDVSWHRADLLDPRQARELVSSVKPSHLMHFAWETTPGEYWTSTENYRWVSASLDLVQVFHECGGKRIVVAGTAAEYSWNHIPCSEETTPLKPLRPYGICKYCLQLMVHAFASQVGMSVAWGRIFSVYGPNENPRRLVPHLTARLLRQEEALCTDGHQIRDYLYVEDVGEAFAELLESEFSGAINIASGLPIAIRDLSLKIAKMLGRTDLLRIGAIPTDSNEPDFLVADVERLASQIGWRPKYDLDAGIQMTISWWRDRVSKGIQQDSEVIG